MVHLTDPKNSHVRCNGRGYTHILSHAYTCALRPLCSIWCNASGLNVYACVVVQGKLSLSSLRVKLLSLSLWVKSSLRTSSFITCSQVQMEQIAAVHQTVGGIGVSCCVAGRSLPTHMLLVGEWFVIKSSCMLMCRSNAGGGNGWKKLLDAAAEFRRTRPCAHPYQNILLNEASQLRSTYTRRHKCTLLLM